MKSYFVFLAIFLGVVIIVLGISFFTPLPVSFYQDFSVMFFTNLGLLKGIPIYDYSRQLPFVEKLTPPGFTFHPFPYPPWYALATIYLGLLPVRIAARFWFFCNLTMLGLSVWLLTPNWKTMHRILGITTAIMFLPSFGLLVVGQYSAPVLLGATLFIYSARKKSSVLSALSMLLMTFKPHIGILLLLSGLVWLFAERSSFSRRALGLTIFGGVFLAMISFLADPAWPVSYIQSLSRYGNIRGVQTCALCASLSVTAVQLVTGRASTSTAAWVSLALVFPLGIFVWLRLRHRLHDPFFLIALFAVLTLLLDPYLLNYDFTLMLIPLFWLFDYTLPFTLALYLVPGAAILYGRDSNIIFGFAALVTLILIFRYSRSYPHIWD